MLNVTQIEILKDTFVMLKNTFINRIVRYINFSIVLKILCLIFFILN